MRTAHVFTCLTLGAATLLLSACSSTTQQALYYSSGTSELVIEPNCLQNVSMEKDLKEREFIRVGVIETEDCYGELDSWIQSHIGEEVTLIFNGETVSGPSLVVSPLAANDIWITSENNELLSDVYKYISAQN